MVNATDRIWHNVHRAWLKRLARSIRILKENGVYLSRDKDYAYQVAYNVEGTRVVEQRSGICRVEYVDAPHTAPKTLKILCKVLPRSGQ